MPTETPTRDAVPVSEWDPAAHLSNLAAEVDRITAEAAALSASIDRAQLDNLDTELDDIEAVVAQAERSLAAIEQATKTTAAKLRVVAERAQRVRGQVNALRGTRRVSGPGARAAVKRIDDSLSTAASAFRALIDREPLG